MRTFNLRRSELGTALAALVVAATAAVGVLVPATAYAAASPPSILWAGSVEGDFGRVRVGTYAADAGVTAVRVHVRQNTTGAELAVMDAFHLVDGTGSGWSTWESDGEVILPDLGYYRLDVEATAADGAHAERDDAGTLVYAVKMFYKNLNVTNSVSGNRPQAVVTGRLMGRWPGTLAEQPVTGYPVEFATQYGNFADGVSAEAGQFRLTADIQSTEDTGYVTTLWDYSRPFYLQAYSDTAAPAVRQANTRLTIGLDRSTVAEGDAITVSGVLTWHSADGWKPIPNHYVAVLGCTDPTTDSCFGPYYYAYTDEQGRYSVTTNPVLGGYFQAGTYNDDPFVTTTTFARAAYAVTHPTTFPDLYAFRAYDGQVEITGHLAFTVHFSPGTAPIQIQYQRAGTSSWHTVRTVDIARNPWNPEGLSFDEFLAYPGAGRWRVTFSDPYGFFADSVSPVVALS